MDNKKVIEDFYNAFKQLDDQAMHACYSSDVVYHDPVYHLLRGDAVKYMWSLFCTQQAHNFQLSYQNIILLDEEYATCEWKASYVYLPTAQKVNHSCKAFMRLADGKITEHSDAYRFSKWIAQSYGVTGYLFGWSGFMKRRIQKKARLALMEYMENEGVELAE